MAYIVHLFWRHAHRWVSLLVAIPFLITLLTGILLATRSFNPWVQPEYPKLASPELSVSFPQLLAAAKSVPEAQIVTWNDVHQIDVRPATGQVRIRAKHDHWEIMVDGVSGEVRQAKKRRVSWLTSLHEGAAFGPVVRYGIFLPSFIGILFVSISGLILFFQPFCRMLRSRSHDKTRARLHP